MGIVLTKIHVTVVMYEVAHRHTDVSYNRPCSRSPCTTTPDSVLSDNSLLSGGNRRGYHKCTILSNRDVTRNLRGTTSGSGDRQKFPSVVQRQSPMGVWGQAPRSRRKFYCTDHQNINTANVSLLLPLY